LANADLEVSRFGFLESFVIVPGDSIGEIGIDAGFLWQNRHQGEVIVANRAEGPEPFHIRDSHNVFYLSRKARADRNWMRDIKVEGGSSQPRSQKFFNNFAPVSNNLVLNAHRNPCTRIV
jgi:hypothetical protein